MIKNNYYSSALYYMFYFISCSEGTNVQQDTDVCAAASGFYLKESDSIIEKRVKDQISDIDLSDSTDIEECGENAIREAKEMLNAAVRYAGIEEEEIEGYEVSYEMFTGSNTRPPGCNGFRIRLERMICGYPVIGHSQIYSEWDYDGTLDIVKGGGGGLIDYQKEVMCNSGVWTLESCKIATDHSGYYVFIISNNRNDRLIKGISIICEDKQEQYTFPVCKDETSSNLCDNDPCLESTI